MDFAGIVQRLLKNRTVDEAALAEDEQRAFVRKRFDILKQDGVPKRIRRQLAELNKTKPTAYVDQFMARPEFWCLVLSSPVGTGKSTAAAYWLWNISPERTVAAGPSMRRWWTACELATISAYGHELPQIKAPGPIVLDDLGTEYADKNGHFLRIMDDLIDARYREELPTIITTNLNNATFATRYGQRIADRIREGGAFFEFNGESMRGKG